MKKKTRLVCFSFAAYAKTLIAAVKSTGVHVTPGLTAAEFSSLESLLRFTFPSDLRAILREGLPISAAGFPDWRAKSPPRILRGCRFRSSPALIPVYGDCYLPSDPAEAGNPVFRVAGDGEVSVVSFDLAGFFRRLVEPVWAAKEARRIEFWTDAAEARGNAWWFRACMEGVSRRLREGGWCEEDVREMTEMDGCDRSDRTVDIWQRGDVVEVTWPVEKLSVVLLRGGWSVEDVEYSFGMESENDDGDLIVF